MHPLSPYYEGSDGWLPVHPQPDGVGYWHWLGWVLGTSRKGDSTRPAQTVARALTLSHRQTGGALRLWAFGYDMDKMKARCWYDATLPLYELGDCMPDATADVQAEAGRWIEAADLTAGYLLSAVRDSWFADVPKSKAANSKKLGYTKASFWAATEPSFYRHLQTLIEAARSGTEHPALAVREAWHTTLRNTALRLFDQSFVGAGAIERQNPRRIALAHKQLRNSLFGPKLRSALGLPVDDPKPKPARKSAASKGPAKEAA